MTVAVAFSQNENESESESVSEKLPSLALPLIVLVVGCLLAVGCWLLC